MRTSPSPSILRHAMFIAVMFSALPLLADDWRTQPDSGQERNGWTSGSDTRHSSSSDRRDDSEYEQGGRQDGERWGRHKSRPPQRLTPVPSPNPRSDPRSDRAPGSDNKHSREAARHEANARRLARSGNHKRAREAWKQAGRAYKGSAQLRESELREEIAAIPHLLDEGESLANRARRLTLASDSLHRAGHPRAAEKLLRKSRALAEQGDERLRKGRDARRRAWDRWWRLHEDYDQAALAFTEAGKPRKAAALYVHGADMLDPEQPSPWDAWQSPGVVAFADLHHRGERGADTAERLFKAADLYEDSGKRKRANKIRHRAGNTALRAADDLEQAAPGWRQIDMPGMAKKNRRKAVDIRHSID